MKAKFVGYNRKNGQFKNDSGNIIEFDNVMLSVLYKQSGDYSDGYLAKEIKVKHSDFEAYDTDGHPLKLADLGEYLDYFVDIQFDDKGRFIMLEVLPAA